jgi:hypothetical protein
MHRALSEQHWKIAVACIREMLVRHHASPEMMERTRRLREAMSRLGFGEVLSKLPRPFPTNPTSRNRGSGTCHPEMRRLGVGLAEHPNPSPGGRDYNAYVERIDALLVPTQEFTALVSEILTKIAWVLFDALYGKTEAAREAWFDALLMHVEQDSNLRLDLFYILVAFGCPGGVDVVAYLRDMRSAAQPGR